jgi:hypothetical protein
MPFLLYVFPGFRLTWFSFNLGPGVGSALIYFVIIIFVIIIIEVKIKPLVRRNSMTGRGLPTPPTILNAVSIVGVETIVKRKSVLGYCSCVNILNSRACA